MKLKYFAILISILISYAGAYSQKADLTKGLLVYHTFNGTTLDLSGNENHASEGTFAKSMLKEENGALELKNSHVTTTLKEGSIYLPEYSVSFWIKPMEDLNFHTDTVKTLISNASGAFKVFYYGGALNIELSYQKEGGRSSSSSLLPMTFSKNEWYFIVINNKEKQQSSITVNEHTTELNHDSTATFAKFKPNIIFGATNFQNKDSFNCFFDDFRLYNRTLNESEINTLYTRNTKISETPKPVAVAIPNSSPIIENALVKPPANIELPNLEPDPIITNERRIALIIGNADYAASAKLRNPVNDARLMAAELKSLGFEVMQIENGTRIQMLDSISVFGNELAKDKNSIGLFYYAGHGMQVKGKNFIIPIDAKIEKESDAGTYCIDLDNLMGNLEDARNNMNLIILDACRNNPFGRSFRATAGSGLATVANQPKGTFIAFATAPGTVAADGEGENGLYTQEFVKVLKIPKLKIEDVFKRVRVGVSEKSSDRQIPWDNSSLVGDFYFKRK